MSKELSLFGYTNLNEIPELLSHLFEINLSAELNYDEIIDSFYLGTIIDAEHTPFDLADKFIPNVEGKLEDLLTDASKNNIPEQRENEESSPNNE